MKTSLSFLYQCIQTLGIRLGFRYWKIYRAAKKSPAIILDWASNCEREALALEFFKKSRKEAAALRSWATRLREHYNRTVN